MTTVRRLRSDVDLLLVGSALAAAVLGLLMVASATRPAPGFLIRQLVWVVVGVTVMAGTLAVDLGTLRRLAPVAYAASTLALLAVLTPLGSQANGAQAWFDLGPLRVQPAELAKPALVLALAAHGQRSRGRLGGGKLLGALALAGLPLGLVILQPDLGTAVVLAVVTGGVLVVAGAPSRQLAGIAVCGGAVVVAGLRAGMLAPYQLDRLTSFLHQSADPLGATWNLQQAKIAIGSGGLAGAGLFAGSQTALAYVPEQHTDFVFTVVGEELGLLGGVTLLGLFGLLAWRVWRAAWLAPDPFGSLCGAGVLAVLVFQAAQNLGMTLGLTPITGIPLPFVSYGGSSTVACFAAAGLAANVGRARRYVPMPHHITPRPAGPWPLH